MSETRTPALGNLTDRIQLQRRVSTSEDEGGAIVTWSPLSTVWARVRQLSTRQGLAEDARGQAITHSVVLRFRLDVGPGDRLIYRGRTLDIAGAADLNGRRAYLSLQCVERAVTG